MSEETASLDDLKAAGTPAGEAAEEQPVLPPAQGSEPGMLPSAESTPEALPAHDDATAVLPLTAADIPALDGCDVEGSWSGDETCAGTEAIEAPESSESPSGELDVPDPAVAVAAGVAEAAAGDETAQGESEASVEAAASAAAADQMAAAIGDSDAALPATAPTWPFAAYLALWAVLCVLAGWQLMQIPASQPIALTETYRYTVLGGVIMTAAGPIIILAVWLVGLLRAGDRPTTGLLATSLLKGGAVTLLGVLMWWGTLLLVDQARLGRFF